MIEFQSDSNLMNRNIVILVAVVLAFIAFVMAWLVARSYITNMAYNDCAKSSQYTVRQGDATISYPVPEVFQDCLKRVSK